MNRIPLIAGNWKMYKTAAEARAFMAALVPEIAATERRVFIAPPFPAIETAAEAAKGTRIWIGGQNMHDHAEGAYTGEVSARMLTACGARFVILGHSERRQYFSESNAFIRCKIFSALQEGLTPILCVGERLEDREKGDHMGVLRRQLEDCLLGISTSHAADIVIAYEPVWAIGTGRTATPEMAQEVHRFIREYLAERFGREASEKMCLLYGGSVRPDNIAALMQQTDIDGALVGGASLDAKTFAQIVNY